MMRYRLFHTVLLLSFVVAGCSDDFGRRGIRETLNRGSGIPPVAGGRIASVLMLPGVSTTLDNSGYVTSGISSSNPQLQNEGANGNRSVGNVTYPAPGETGILETISISSNQMQFVGDRGSYGVTRQGVSNGMTGRTTGFAVKVLGIDADESQIAYSTDGSILYITAPALEGVWVYRMGDNGSYIGSPYLLNVRGRPSEIATARTEYGEMAAVVTPSGISFIKADRFNLQTGGAEARVVKTLSQFGMETPKTVAFSPSGQYLFVGTQPSNGPGSRLTGYLRVCAVGQMTNHELRGTIESYFEANRPIGCFDGDPAVLSGVSNGGFPIGAQTAQGLPFKLAVTNELLVSLNESIGPVILLTPNVDMDPTLVQEISGDGPTVTANYIGKSLPGSQGLLRKYVDVGAFQGMIFGAREDGIDVISTQNVYEAGRHLDTVPMHGSRISAIAVDSEAVVSQTGSKMMLVADRNNIWHFPLSDAGITAPNGGDRTILTGTAIDVALRTEMNFRAAATFSQQNPGSTSDSATTQQ